MNAPFFVPLDGSPWSEHALPWALTIAERARTNLWVVGVHVPPVNAYDGEILVASPIDDTSITDREWRDLNDVLVRCKAVSDVDIGAELAVGPVVSALVESTQRLKARFAVMAGHPRSLLGRFFLGSTSHEFVVESPIPVLVVRGADSKPDLSHRPNLRNIVIPLDGSSFSERSIPDAIELGKLFDADYTLTMSLDGVPDISAIAEMIESGMPGAWDEKAVPEKAALYLEHQADTFRARGLRVKTRFIEHGPAARGILDVAGSLPESLIAMTTHGRGGLRRALYGSIADQVVREFNGPILLFRPQESDRQS